MNDNLQQTLLPHIYPLWIKMGFVLCCITLLYCLFSFPFYFSLNTKIKKAHAAFRKKDYLNASMHYTEISDLIPKNRPIRLCAAQALFKSPDTTNHQLAFNYLKNISLKENEWDELLHYMPSEYIDFFEDAEIKIT